MMWRDDDEGPSADDLDRFGDDAGTTGYCPQCGGPCYDDAPVCPHCGVTVDRLLPRPKAGHDMQRRFGVVVVVLVLIAFFWVVL
ncbi:MAG: hypothetical protein MK074_07450 [Phycisphaerales bacterium]|nr:hypothetical protein [Phycisphaerales bacterium]